MTTASVQFLNQDSNSYGVQTSDPYLIQTYDWYRSLVGTSFIGVYRGIWPILQGESTNQITRNCAVIVFRFDPHEISPTLSSIVTQDPLNRVWKAITGPDEGNHHTDYWLWTKAPVHGAIAGQRQTYTITGVSCFLDDIRYCNHVYKGGVELTVEASDILQSQKTSR